VSSFEWFLVLAIVWLYLNGAFVTYGYMRALVGVEQLRKARTRVLLDIVVPWPLIMFRAFLDPKERELRKNLESRP
jgi:hypothetical protein